MTEDETQVRTPDDCKRCQHRTLYITAGRERYECEIGKPMKAECLWFVPSRYARSTT